MIGKKIKARRIQLNMTQDELAQKLGYKSRSTINKIELDKNDVSQSKLVKLAAALECDPIDLLDTPPYDIHSPSEVNLYAKKLSELTPENLDSVIKYIDFLLRTQNE